MSQHPYSKPQKPQTARSKSRRNFLRDTAAVGSGSLLLPAASQAAGTSLEGYTNWPSVAVGGTLDFYLRDPQAVGTGTTVYPISFTRIAPSDVFMSSATVSIGNQTVPADASTNGCRWARTYRLTVPSNWPSGLYYAYIGSGANACTVPFVVRAVTRASATKTLVCVPMLTVQAYNNYGGKSIYEYNSSGGVRAYQVSLDRPLNEDFITAFDRWSQFLVRWMAKNGLAANFCTDLDIEVTPTVLNGYTLYMQAGHDEYWTVGRRTTMDNFVANGGNAAYLGGNTCWWQIRLAASNGVANRTLVCYKDAAADPTTDPALETINWISKSPPKPENSTVGLGFVTGCSWVGALTRPDTPLVVQRAEHWAFAGTSLAQGAGFAGAYVGYECNSAAVTTGTDQRLYPTGLDGTPATMRILAQADGSNWDALSLAAGGSGEQSGTCTVAVFSRGGTAGTVFCAGMTDWAYGLGPELNGQTATPISRITLNVFNKLSADYTESADVRQFSKVVTGTLVNAYLDTGTSAPTGSGMALAGWVFRAFPQAVSGSARVYRHRSSTAGSSGTRYRYSRTAQLGTTTTAAGVSTTWVQEAVAFNAYALTRSDATAVYEHYALVPGTLELLFLYTTQATAPSGWTSGPVVFYAPTDGVAAAAVASSFCLTTASASAASLSVNTGSTAQSDLINVSQLGGFTSLVNFTVAGLPSGVTATLVPASSTTGARLSVTASSSAAGGTSLVTITGTSGTVTSRLVLPLVVIKLNPGFTLSSTKSTLSLPYGALLGASATISVVRVDGFTAAVGFSISGLPAGLQATFSNASSATSTYLTVKKQTSATVADGVYTLTITGTSGSLQSSVTVQADVRVLT